MKSNEEKIEKLRRLLSEAGEILDEVTGHEDEEKADVEDIVKDRVELWCRVYNEGGPITRERLLEIWTDEMGKQGGQGLGGFYKGTDASLARTADGKVILTKSAADQIEEWTGKEISEYAKRFKK